MFVDGGAGAVCLIGWGFLCERCWQSFCVCVVDGDLVDRERALGGQLEFLLSFAGLGAWVGTFVV